MSLNLEDRSLSEVVLAVLLLIPVFALIVAFGSWIMTLLWAATMVPIFHLPAITMWQALWLDLLSAFLFRGFNIPSTKSKE